MPVVWDYITNTFMISDSKAPSLLHVPPPSTILCPITRQDKTDLFLSFCQRLSGRQLQLSCLLRSALLLDGSAVFSNIIWCKQQNFAAFLLQCNFQTFLFHLAGPLVTGGTETCTNFPLAQNLLGPATTTTSHHQHRDCLASYLI